LHVSASATSAAASIHPVTFGITFLLFAVWFLETDRLWPFALFAVLAMSTGELMGLPVAGLGVWYALAHGRRRAGGVIAAGAAAWTFFAIYVVVPAVRGEGSIFFGFYEEAGGSPLGVVRTLVTDPLTLVRLLAEPHDLVYLLWLGLPLLFLFLLSPGLAAVAIPQLLANGLSDFRSMTDPRYHSVAAVIPFLLASTVLGIARLPVGRRTVAAAAVLTCGVSLSLVVGPWPRALGVKPLGGRDNVAPARVDALRAAAAVVPSEVPLMTSNAAGAHLSARRYVYSVPIVGGAEWAVVDLGDPWVVTGDSPILTRDPGAVSGLAKRLRSNRSWRLVFERNGVLVFRRLDS